MKKIRRYVAQSVWGAVLTVLLVIVALDAIAGIVDQLDKLRGNYTFLEAIIYVSLYLPSTIYDYLPLSALVGCLVGLGSLATTSELVVMRAAGVSVAQIIYSVFRPVMVFIIAGALIGEYVAPYMDQYADSRKSLAQGHSKALISDRGLWNRDGNEFMHFNAVLPNGKLFGITRYRFDDNRLVEASFSDSAIYQGGHWFEQDVRSTVFSENTTQTYLEASRKWDTDLSPSILNVLVLKVDELPMRRLYSYGNYLEKQSLDASDYKLAFWQKALQPLATLSLVMIAISFILGPLRQVTMGYRVFIGVIVGLAFQTSQKLLGPSSIILGFSPMYAVMIPICISFLAGFVMLRSAR